MLEDSDKATLAWNELRNQQDWERHNESQRAQLSTILLALSAALVALLPKDKPLPLKHDDWLIPAFLIFIGVFGFVAVMKYWERFRYHEHLEDAYRKIVDSYFAPDGKPLNDEDRISSQRNLFLKTREDAIKEHEKGWLPFPKNRHLMQHRLWQIVFLLIAVLGVFLIVTAQ